MLNCDSILNTWNTNQYNCNVLMRIWHTIIKTCNNYLNLCKSIMKKWDIIKYQIFIKFAKTNLSAAAQKCPQGYRWRNFIGNTIKKSECNRIRARSVAECAWRRDNKKPRKGKLSFSRFYRGMRQRRVRDSNSHRCEPGSFQDCCHTIRRTLRWYCVEISVQKCEFFLK